MSFLQLKQCIFEMSFPNTYSAMYQVQCIKCNASSAMYQVQSVKCNVLSAMCQVDKSNQKNIGKISGEFMSHS
jgi:hypothetical protein